MRPFFINRRQFLRRSAKAAALSGLPFWFIEQNLDAADSKPPTSPNDKPGIALIGCGGQGRGDAKAAQKFGNLIAVCDVDRNHAESAAKELGATAIYTDFRALLERQDIHAIINGTPDHWHTLINLAIFKAGKDVYSEKPLTLTIEEGWHLVEAARISHRILQTGSQQRSDPRFRLACELVRNGRIGKLQHVISSLPEGPRRGPFQKAQVPPGLDWNFWQGQTAERDYVPERCHSNFRYWLDYSGGTMTDWGAHHNDIVLWGLGLERSGPSTIHGRRLIEPIPGGFDAPSAYQVDYTYANGVTHRCQSTSGNGPDGSKRGESREGEIPHGVKFVGSDGWIFVTRGKIEASKPNLISEPLKNKKVELYASDNHMGNFFDCIRSRRQPICEPEIGHRSVSVCHLGVIAIRLGRKLQWNPQTEQFVGDWEANSYLSRPQRKPFTYDMI